ncbi:MAG: tRNA lysidine(34) synthetase TilS [Pirellulales bacterium]
MVHDSANLETVLVDGWPPAEWRDVHVVLAVSGGADSVALLRALRATKERAGGQGRLHVAHLNHGIRPADAAADEAWLADLCRRLDVPLAIGRADVSALAAHQGDGLEAAARDARYDFLLATAERLGARCVAVAHTADDQVETVLHRLIRGTGVAGLAGMPRIRPLSPTVSLVRPFLGIHRQEVLKYLAEVGQDFRTDATNADARFTRNRLRQQLLPLLRSEFNTDVDAALLRLAQQADETQRLINLLAERLFRAAATVSPGLVQIDCRQLVAEPPLLVRETCKLAWTAAGWPLQNMGFDQWQQLATLAAAESRSRSLNLPSGIRATRQGDQLKITKSP